MYTSPVQRQCNAIEEKLPNTLQVESILTQKKNAIDTDSRLSTPCFVQICPSYMTISLVEMSDLSALLAEFG